MIKHKYHCCYQHLALVTMGHTTLADSMAASLTVAASMAASMTVADSMAASLTIAVSMHRVTVIGHISHIAVVVVGVVVDMLCPAVREQHRVRSLSNPCAIVRLVMAVLSTRVAVSHPIVEVVGNDFRLVTVAVAVGNTMTTMAIAGVGLSLVVSTVAVDLRVVANNAGAVVNLLGNLVALLSHNVLALLHIGGVHNGVVLGVADLVVLSVADLPGDGVADLPRDLTGVLDRPLVALPIGFSMALGGGGVAAMSIVGVSLSLSLPLVMSTVAVDLRVVSNNTRAVVNLLRHLVALLGNNVLALLHIGGVHNSVVLGVADLVVLSMADWSWVGDTDLPRDLTRVLDGLLMALPLSVGITLGSGRVPSVAASMASMATSMASLASVAAYMASIAASMASIAASMAGSGTGQGRNRDD